MTELPRSDRLGSPRFSDQEGVVQVIGLVKAIALPFDSVHLFSAPTSFGDDAIDEVVIARFVGENREGLSVGRGAKRWIPGVVQ